MRVVSQEGFKTLYDAGGSFKLSVRLLLALAYLPTNAIEVYYSVVRGQLLNMAPKLLEYFEVYYF